MPPALCLKRKNPAVGWGVAVAKPHSTLQRRISCLHFQPYKHHGDHDIMNDQPQGIAYVRDPKTRNQAAPYEQKFDGLIRAIAQNKGSKIRFLLISEPWVIGDTYEEVIESLSRLAGSDLALLVIQRKRNVRNN